MFSDVFGRSASPEPGKKNFMSVDLRSDEWIKELYQVITRLNLAQKNINFIKA